MNQTISQAAKIADERQQRLEMVRQGGSMGSIESPPSFDAANRLATSIQSPCVAAITARVEAISLPGHAFWLEFKKKLSVVSCMDHITKKGKTNTS